MRNNKDFRNYYDNIKKIANCDFGEIYEVKIKDGDERRAIKLINKNLIKNEIKNKYKKEPTIEEINKYINCFKNEIKNMEIIEGKNRDNDNAVKFYEYFETENEFVIVMELCDEKLNYLLSKKQKEKESFTIEEVSDILNQLNYTFKIMIENNIIYKDLKLENFLVKFKNKEKNKYSIKLKITDFSEIKEELHDIFSEKKGNYYCNLFNPPEILKGEKYNEKSNLWNIGILIYILLFMKYPYKGYNNESILNSIKKHGKEQLEKTKNIYLNDLIIKLLVEKPKERISWIDYFNHTFFQNKIEKKDFRKNFSDYYEIGKLIGQSEFSNIYEAKDKNTNEFRAIKVYYLNKIKTNFKQKLLREPTSNEIKIYTDCFFNEMKIMKLLENKENTNINSVKFYESFCGKDKIISVMELCDDTLLNILSCKKTPFNSKEIYNILIQLNNCFKIMAKNKIIHRALNLENILIKYENKEKNNYIIKLKITEESILLKDLKDFQFPTSNNIYFIAPEILKREKYDEKCDLWSLGIIIYILYFKQYPFIGLKEQQLIKQIKEFSKMNIKKTDNINLDHLIHKLLIEDPQKRLSWEQYFNHSFFIKKSNKKVNDFRYYYDIITKIGDGGFADVYMAKIKNNNEKRAIKIFNKSKIRNELLQRNLKKPNEEQLQPIIDGFIRETENMKILEGKNNQNTVKFYEYYNSENEFIIVMELCDDNLTNYLADKKDIFNPEDILDFLSQLNNSFKIMYENRLAHRDLKLENILIKYDNQGNPIFKLTDYGLSKQLISNNNKFHSKVGTLNFMAPEIIKGEEYNNECDLWSLGVIIYILCFKRYPYDGNGEIEFLKQIKETKQERFFKTNNSNLDNLIRSLLLEDQRERLTWKDYFEHPFFKQNIKNNNIMVNNKIKNNEINNENIENNKKMNGNKENNEYNILSNNREKIGNNIVINKDNIELNNNENNNKENNIINKENIENNKENIENNKINNDKNIKINKERNDNNLIIINSNEKNENNILNNSKEKIEIDVDFENYKININQINEKKINSDNYKIYENIPYIEISNRNNYINNDIKEINQIIIKIKVEKNDKENNKFKDIYFLGNNEFENKKNGELNENNCKIYVNNEEINFNKYFKPINEGEYEIRIILLNRIKNCSYMFNNCNNIISIDLSSFDSSDVTNMSSMFKDCINLNNLILDNLNTNNVTDMSFMFKKCCFEKIDFPLSFNTKKVKDMKYMFESCKNLFEIEFLDFFETNNVTNMKGMFDKCHNLSKINLTNFNTENVEDMSFMFSECSKLEIIELNPSKFTTKQVIDMNHMFNECSNLKEINLNSFNTERVKNMSYMFYKCHRLIAIDISNFQINNRTNLEHMLDECNNITELNLSSFKINDSNKTDKMLNNLKKIKKIIVNKDYIEKYKKIFKLNNYNFSIE